MIRSLHARRGRFYLEHTMFIVGRDVVCIDDTFDATEEHKKMNLPRKGVTYTIRDISIGELRPGRLLIGFHLKNLYNEPDLRPGPLCGKEPLFVSTRFVPA